MNTSEPTREDMWAMQSLHPRQIDYTIWDRDKAMLQQMAKISRSCTFVVDVYKCKYTFASPNFAGLLGYDPRKIETIGQRDDDYLESRIHPDDLSELKSIQIELSRFIYSRPAEERNDYRNIFGFRVLDAQGEYIRVTSRHQVLETSATGKAWLILGMMDIAPDQRPQEGVKCTVQNLKTGELFPSPGSITANPWLTGREIEVLQLIKHGLQSKEIACKLGISIHTVNIHRQNLFRKLRVQNAIEAINLGSENGLIV